MYRVDKMAHAPFCTLVKIPPIIAFTIQYFRFLAMNMEFLASFLFSVPYAICQETHLAS